MRYSEFFISFQKKPLVAVKFCAKNFATHNDFDENKDGELSVTEVHYPMGLMKAMGLPYEDLFAKHMESVSISIEGNYFVIKYLCM